MAVLRPLKLVIENYPEGESEELDAVNNPEDPAAGIRRDPVRPRALYRARRLHREPAQEVLPPLAGQEVRLRYAYFVTCREAVKDAAGEVVELRCTYDPATRGGNAPDGRKVRATLHWVSAAHAVPAEIRLYNPLFTRPDPDADGDLSADLNPNSLEVLSGAGSSRRSPPTMRDEPVQFERQGYFCRDPDIAAGRLVFNRTVGLRDSWAKAQASGG